MFLAKASRLPHWTLIKAPLLHRHQEHPRAEHLCVTLLVLFRKRDGKVTAAFCISSSLGLSRSVGNTWVWELQHPLPPETRAPEPGSAGAKGNVLLDFSTAGVRTQKGRLP